MESNNYNTFKVLIKAPALKISKLKKKENLLQCSSRLFYLTVWFKKASNQALRGTFLRHRSNPVLNWSARSMLIIHLKSICGAGSGYVYVTETTYLESTALSLHAHTLPFKSLGMFLKQVSSAPQGCIYLMKNPIKTVILWNIITISNNCFLCEYTVKWNLFLWSKMDFQHHYSSVTWSFRNQSNMLICCSRNISDYYQCWKTVVLLHMFVKTLIPF